MQPQTVVPGEGRATSVVWCFRFCETNYWEMPNGNLLFWPSAKSCTIWNKLTVSFHGQRSIMTKVSRVHKPLVAQKVHTYNGPNSIANLEATSEYNHILTGPILT